MPEKQKFTLKEQIWMIREVEHSGKGLSDWEKGFMANIKTSVKGGKHLSDDQVAKLDDIYTKRTP